MQATVPPSGQGLGAYKTHLPRALKYVSCLGQSPSIWIMWMRSNSGNSMAPVINRHVSVS